MGGEAGAGDEADVVMLSEVRGLHHERARTANEWSSMQQLV